MQRQSVFKAVHATRVLGHVAAYGAGDLAGRVRRVIQAQGCGGLADSQVAHTALHHGRAAAFVQFEDFVELGQRQGHAQGVWHGTAGQAGACAARHHGHVHRKTDLQDGCHLCLGLRQGYDQWALAVGGQAVTFIRGGVFAVPQQGM